MHCTSRHFNNAKWRIRKTGIEYDREKIIMIGRTPNDDRSDSLNPNNDAYDHSMDNHSNQLNPNNDRYQGDEDED